MNRHALALLGALLVASAAARAQEASVNFPPGSGPATVKGHVNPLSSSECKLTVSPGQRVRLHLTSTSRKKLVRFSVRRDRFKGEPMTGARGLTDWEGVLKEGGDYWIPVFALPDAGEEDFTLVVSAPPQEEAPREAAPAAPQPGDLKVPEAGARPQDFAPPGWKIAAREDGDLNGDGRPDAVLQLVPASTPDERAASDAAPEAQALVALLADGAGWRRAGVARKLLVADAPQYSLDLKIRKDGVVVVEQDYGMSDVTNLKHLFRYDAQDGRLRLIGRDVYTYTRPLQYDTVKTSENYLSGMRLTTTGRVRGGIVAGETTKREQIGARKIYFDDVNENPDQ